MNTRAGICEECGEYFTVTSGGLNEHGQCKTCEIKFPVAACCGVDAPVKVVASGSTVGCYRDGQLIDEGVGLGEC